MNSLSQNKKAFLEGFFGPNLGYVIEQFERFQKDPDSVSEELQSVFRQMEEGDFTLEEAPTPAIGTSGSLETEKILEATRLAENVRKNGHLAAKIYPLGNPRPEVADIDLKNYQLTREDLMKMPANLLCKNAPSSIQNGYEAYEYLKKIYTESIAYEIDHVHNAEEKNWLLERIESGKLNAAVSREKKIGLLKRLMEVDGFEKFLHKTFVGQKRFSIEGLDVMVPMMDEMVSEAVQDGADSVNIGMAHRGRLNVLAHVLGKPYEMIFAEFQHSPNKELVPSEGSIGINFGWTGDVKYHLGLNRQISNETTSQVKISLANNPSHLEFVGAIVEGYTRAVQDNRNQPGYPVGDFPSSLAILVHGDAAFPGEGIVAETLNLSRLNGYRTGGTIHIISNNTIGFTTESKESRSTLYASDLAKGFEIPILHVNADEPESCLAAAAFAVEYRSRFQKDILIDLVGYRRFGHNEMDEPMMTNPLLYTLVQKHSTIKELYFETLKKQGIADEQLYTELETGIQEKFKKAYEKVSTDRKEEPVTIPEPPRFVNDPSIQTKVPEQTLKAINDELIQYPEGFNVFNKLERILKRRAEALRDSEKVDWSLAETLAFATILADGTPVRITGQDTERGTFAHRHLVLHDSNTGEKICPLHLLSDAKASFAIHNSPLTETAVVGFEYGYNISAPDTLVLWEAQYGDFANVAQVIFDQFIAAGRAKWGQKSGLVLLLPHGYEGQGPEHSSGRVERFLQLAAEKNWTVANLTSASQYFHILRRQAALLEREEVRPLVIMSPKSLLRNPLVSSSLKELSEGEFKPVLEQFEADPKKVERLVIGTGKITIDIAEQVQSGNDYDWLQVLRLEQIYPFPTGTMQELIAQYENLKEIVWIQEEPKNMGAWYFVEPRINELASPGIQVKYAGRRRRSSPAEGDPNVHKYNQAQILHEALTRTKEEE